ncbi:MAG: metallophosphoesterase [Deltaproteobacteria bacterium]|nr:MAG: metallophosphoesterase [Deltaproteobacteria bacterium]
MRIGIFSDVHGNLDALTKVFEAYRAQSIDRYVCLGDIVGYGAQPDECCTLIRERADVTILGNHDAAVAGRMDYSYYYDAARHALDWCKERLSPENLAWLESLPYRVDDEAHDIVYCHGNPLNPEAYEYIFALEQVQEMLEEAPKLARANFIGHSHLTKCFALNTHEAIDVVGQKFRLKDGYRYIITVGSVGQPRDYDNRACAGIYDTEAETFEYLRVEYDIEAAARKIFDAELALNFGKRLFLGI